MLGEKIDKRRRELGLSQRELAARSGLSTTYISALIKGHRGSRIGAKTLQNLAKALRVSQKFFSNQSTYSDKLSDQEERREI